MTAALLLILLGLLASVMRGGACAPGQAGAPRLVALLCLFQGSLTLFFNLATKSAVPLILVLWLVVFLLARSGRAGLAAAGTVAAGLAAFAVSLAMVPPTTPGADMLPFIAHAIDVFRAGGDPYVADYGWRPLSPPARDRGPMLAVAGLGSAVTISCNSYMHSYYDVAGFLLAGLGLSASSGNTAWRLPADAA